MGQPAADLCEAERQRRVVPLACPDRSVLIFRVKLALAPKSLFPRHSMSSSRKQVTGREAFINL